jgi:membrane-bound lytic murein transglycosylase MltF
MNTGLRRLLLFVVAGAAGGTGISTFTQGQRASELRVSDPVEHLRGEALNAQPALAPDSATNRCIRRYGPSIKKYALQYGFDWRLILAIMKQESRYARNAKSSRGATGLMQLMPATGIALARALELDDISLPEHNIQAGVFHLRRLYDLFNGAEEADRVRLTLAAYNAGFSRIHDAQELALRFEEKPLQWQTVRRTLPLLSRQIRRTRDKTAGLNRHNPGRVGNTGETILYVDSVMYAYGTFRQILN